MATPYSPIPFTTPVVNPAVGGFGAAQPYISTSMYQYAPTAMNTNSLVPGGTAAQNTQALYDTINRACRWADRYVFGSDPAAKGASLAATLSVESAFVPMINGEIRLVCDYKPILELTGLDVGPDPSNVVSVYNTVSSLIRFGRRVIYVPLAVNYFVGRNQQASQQAINTAPGRQAYAVWSYVNGFPHSSLASSVVAGATSVTLVSTDGNGGLFGVYPGTQMTIKDGVSTETFQVSSVTGSTITTVEPLQFAHTVPTAPDFLPVTALSDDITLAVIFFTTALIKTRGDFSITLHEMAQPTDLKSTVGDVETDVAYAMELLDPFRIRVKGRN